MREAPIHQSHVFGQIKISQQFLKRVTQGTFLWNYFKIWPAVSEKIFLRISSCPYIVQEAPIHQSHVFGQIKISQTIFEKGHPRVVRCPSSVVNNFFNIFSSQTAGPIWTKLGRNVPWEVLFKNCSQNLIPSKTLVAMAMKLNFLGNSLKLFSSGTVGQILK